MRVGRAAAISAARRRGAEREKEEKAMRQQLNQAVRAREYREQKEKEAAAKQARAQA